MVAGVRIVLGAVIAAAVLSGCAAASEPPQPPSNSPMPTIATPSTGPSPVQTPSPSQTPSPTATLSGLTLRQLGFANGPIDAFSLPSELQISTRVDQPNVVTIVLARPSPDAIEDYLRATLPGEGFSIDARATAGQAMTFAGHGWSGGFTGTGNSSAVVLRPR